MKAMNECTTCELISRRDRGEAPFWDSIYRTVSWDIVHAYDTALPGWLVIVARRHLRSIDEMSDQEASELGILLRRVSKALKQVTGCLKTYVLQFAEHPKHPHVHFHIIPRMTDQPEEKKATKIMGYLGVPQNERVTEEVMNELGKQVLQQLLRFDSNE
jgi:diadenosine tetraphosphate (Ap4A) HIT family hydrolase